MYIKRKNTPPTTSIGAEPKPVDNNIPLGIIFFFLLLGLFGFVPTYKASAYSYTYNYDTIYNPFNTTLVINVEDYYRIEESIGTSIAPDYSITRSSDGVAIWGIVDYDIQDLVAGDQNNIGGQNSIEDKTYRAYNINGTGGIQTTPVDSGYPTITVSGKYRLYFHIAYLGFGPNPGLGYPSLVHTGFTNSDRSNGYWDYSYDQAPSPPLYLYPISDNISHAEYKFDGRYSYPYPNPNLNGATLLTKTITPPDTEVRDPLTVKIKANGQNPASITSGSSVDVTWEQTGAVACDCTYINSTGTLISCGSGIGTGTPKIQTSAPRSILGVTTETTFNVHCN